MVVISATVISSLISMIYYTGKLNSLLCCRNWMSSINISPTFGLKNMYAKCCLKVLGGTVNETSNTETSSTCFFGYMFN